MVIYVNCMMRHGLTNLKLNNKGTFCLCPVSGTKSLPSYMIVGRTFRVPHILNLHQ
jgi:hypothetical protein